MGKSVNKKKTLITLTIKNMVCERCIRVVREELENLGMDVRSVILGEAIVGTGKSDVDLTKIRRVMEANGFEILDDQKAWLVEKIKKTIITLIHRGGAGANLTINYSHYIAKELNAEYHYLSSLFSSIEGVTIEKYIILQKTERVKELLKYGELTLSEIAYRMNYSSVAHLSGQFKKTTGLTPSEFKKMSHSRRKPIDRI